MSFVGRRIKALREQMGLEQAAISSQLGTTQQTVSRWERGETIPSSTYRERLANLLGVPLAELHEAARLDRESRVRSQHSTPARPLLAELPFRDLPWERFQELVEAVARVKYPHARVSAVGGPGDSQGGFDVEVVEGSRIVAGIQVKRVNQFGKAAARKAIEADTLVADEKVIVLSRSVTRDTQTEVHAHPTWTIWGARELSDVIRELPPEKAARIVQTYFPRHLTDFLGIPGPTAWQTPDEYFEQATPTRLLSHGLPLVGHVDLLRDLTKFVRGGDRPISLLIGRGGTGKSRILLELCERLEELGTEVRLAMLQAPISPDDFALLPVSSDLLVVVDDVHDRDDVVSVVAGILRHAPDAKVLLALRAYGEGRVRAELAKLQLLRDDVDDFHVGDLVPTEAAQLAQEAIGSGDPSAPGRDAERIGAFTADVPYLAVVAGRLLASGSLNQTTLASEESFRERVVALFAQAELRDVADGIRRDVLDAVTSLQPFISSDASFQASLAAIVGQPYDRILPILRGLEDTGILLRRGDMIRVVPDLLGDAILVSAAADTRAGSSSGYLDRVWRNTSAGARPNLLINACRADRQAAAGRGGSMDLTGTMWAEVIREVVSLDTSGLANLVGLLEKVAYFAPRETLSTVRTVLARLESIVGSPTESTGTPASRVREVVPAVLRNVAYNAGHLQEVVELLWELAPEDLRDKNHAPDHPIRVLQSLASYGPDKPVGYSAVVLEQAAAWLHTPQATGSWSPLDVVDVVFATEASETRYDGRAVTWRRYPVRLEVVGPLRRTAVALALEELVNPDLRRAGRACRTLENALRGPIGEDLPATWTTELEEELSEIARVVAGTALNPSVCVALRGALLWHLEYSSSGTRLRATDIVDGLGDALDVRLAQALFDGWGHLHRARTGDFAADSAEKDREISALSAELLASYAVNSLCDLIRERLTEQAMVTGSVHGAGPLLYRLSRDEPAFGEEWVTRLVSMRSIEFEFTSATVLCGVFEADPARAQLVAASLEASAEWELRCYLATAVGIYRGSRPLSTASEADMILRLACDENPRVRAAVAMGLRRLEATDLPFARQLLASLSLDDPEVLDEVMATMVSGDGLRWERLGDGAQQLVLDKIVESRSLEGYWIGEFIARLKKTNPVQLSRLLVRRIERAEALPDGGAHYDPIPAMGSPDSPDDTPSTPPDVVLSTLVWLLDGIDKPLRRREGGRLIRLIAGEFSDDVLAVLADFAAIPSEARMSVVSRVLAELPSRVVLERPAFISTILRAADRVGVATFELVASSISVSFSTGWRTSEPGQPDPSELALERQLREIAGTLPDGSLEHRFYVRLADAALERAHWFVARDTELELMDGRDWTGA